MKRSTHRLTALAVLLGILLGISLTMVRAHADEMSSDVGAGGTELSDPLSTSDVMTSAASSAGGQEGATSLLGEPNLGAPGTADGGPSGSVAAPSDEPAVTGDDDGPGTKTPTSIGTVDVRWLRGGEVDEGGVLQLTPADNRYDSTAHTLTPLSITAMYDFTLAGGGELEPGQVEVRIPAHLFPGRAEGKWGDTYEVGVPKAPATGNAEFNYTYDAATDELVLTNCKTITAAGHHSVEVTYTIAHPSDIEDMHPEGGEESFSKPFQATVTVTEEDQDEPVTATSNQIFAQIDTFADITRSMKYASRMETEWQDAWGERPADADDYFYVVWGVLVQANVNTNQPYTVTLTDDATTYAGTTPGEVVGYGSTVPVGSFDPGLAQNFQYTFNTSVAMQEDCPVVTIDTPKNASNAYSRWVVLTRYPIDSLVPGTVFKNDATAIITGLDDGLTHEKSPSASFTYKKTTFKAPPGWHWLAKDPWLVSDVKYGAIDALEADGTTDELFFTNYAYSRGYAYTLAEGGDPENPDDYGVTPYTVSLVDDALFLEGDQGQRLGYGDYEITRFHPYSMPLTKYVPNGMKSAYSIELDTDYANYPPLVFYGQFGGSDEWVEIGEARVTTTYTRFSFTPTLEGVTVGGTNKDMVYLPSGCTALKAEVTTTAYSVGTLSRFGDVTQSQSSILCYGMYVRVLPSDRVQGLVSDMETSQFVNFNTLYVRDGSGTQVNDAGSMNSGYYNPTVAGTYAKGVENRDAEVDGTHQYHRMGGYRLGRYGRSGYVSKSVNTRSDLSYNDTSNQRYVVHYQSYMYESFLFSPQDDGYAFVDQIIEDGIWQEQRSGYIYDLLPRGVQPDLSSVVVRHSYGQGSSNSGARVSSQYLDVSAVRNWNGTGRTMLVIRIEDDGIARAYSMYSKTSGAAYSGWYLEFDAHYSWEDIQDYGTQILNSIAYRTDNESIYGGSPDDGGTIREKDLMAGISGEDDPGDTFRYAQASFTVSATTSADTGLTKRVAGGDATGWVTGVNDEDVIVGAGEPYQYRLRTVADTGTTMHDIVLFDSIESYVPLATDPDYQNPQWKGSFVSVDTALLEERGCAPVVYYSTIEDLDISAHTDLTDEAVWSTELPGDPADVHAIAVDCSKRADGTGYVVEEHESALVIVNMMAPEDLGTVNLLVSKDAHAFDGVWERAGIEDNLSGRTEVKLTHSEYTKVGLYPQPVSLEVRKAWADDENRDGLRPSSVTVRLLADGEPVFGADGTELTAELSNENGWAATFEGLPEYDGDQRIDYVVEEVGEIEGYVGTSEETSEYVITLTNTHDIATVDVPVRKAWDDEDDVDGLRPERVTVRLLADGESTGLSIELAEASGWEGVFEGLPAMRDGGVRIAYSVEEDEVSGYEFAISGDVEEGFTITNSHEVVPPEPEPEPTPGPPAPTPPAPTAPTRVVPASAKAAAVPSTGDAGAGAAALLAMLGMGLLAAGVRHRDAA